MIRSLICSWHRRRLARRGSAATADPSGTTAAHPHVGSCRRCQAMLADTDLIAAELADISLPESPGERVWRRIESDLDRRSIDEAMQARPRRGVAHTGFGWLDRVPTWAVAVLAAISVLVFWQVRDRALAGGRHAGADPSVAATPPGEEGLQLAMVPLGLDVGSYVQEISSARQPRAFWNVYRARDPEPEHPYRNLAFEPFVPETLPHGFSVADSKLLHDACCETLQVRYAAPDGWLDVFQCHDNHPIEFGRATVDRRDVSGVVCTTFGWGDGEVRGRSFNRGALSLVVVGNVTDEVLDDVVRELAGQ
ncbi:MAG: hypothetical protein ACE5HV_10975 [Acidobacteriota bacterium]